MRLLTVCLLAVLILTACREPPPPVQDAVKPAQVTLDQFQMLRWLQGTWRGSAAGGGPFYESYIFLNDSTIRSFSYADSTFAQASDSNLIALAGGQVVKTGGGAVWIATRLDSTGVRFDPESGASNSFTWASASHDTWTARLEWPDSAEHPPQTSQMERVGH
jgi:hypothetical protein